MDVSERYYQVYQLCLWKVRRPGQPLTQLTKTEFWRLKRSQVPERQIGRMSGLSEDQTIEFAQLRRQMVHTLPFLVYDRPVPGAIETLERVHTKGIELVTMTMRRTQELEYAFSRYRLGQYFQRDRRYCLSNDYPKTNDVEDKTQLMGQALAELPPAVTTWMVGDTEADILSAKQHGIPVIAVLSGIRDRTQLTQHQPDWIVNNLAEATEVILSHPSLQVG